ncbi:hypothetical protein [Mesorhizobium tamadayense]|nr:hypothetical protein [Mesorhizobium tamadayense]
MRPVLLIVAAVAAFFVWDAAANDGRYWHQFERNIQQVEHFPGLVRVSWN